MADHGFCLDEYASLGYSPLVFGTAACEGPDSAGIGMIVGTDTTYLSNYHSYGYCCQLNAADRGNGTIALHGSGAAALFLPDDMKTLWDYYYNDIDEYFWDQYGYRFWSPVFGMPDAFHLDPDHATDTLINRLGFRGPWVSVPRFGINAGPLLLNIDSYLSETKGNLSVRSYFSGHPAIAPNLGQFSNIPHTDTLRAKISILSSAQLWCAGDTLRFEVVPVHGGAHPFFHWYLDGILVQSDTSAGCSLIPDAGDHYVFCRMESEENCIEGDIANSDTLSFSIAEIHVVGVSITPLMPHICQGDTLVLSATLFDAGESPQIAWTLNGMNTGIYGLEFSTIGLDDQAVVACIVTSSAMCAINNPAASAPATVTVHPLPVITLAPEDTVCHVAPAFLLEQASPPGGMYSGSGITDGVFDPAQAGIGNHLITYAYTDSLTGCSNLADFEIVVAPENMPAVGIQASASAACPGDSVWFMALPVDGGSDPQLQWMLNGTRIDSSGQTILIIAPAQDFEVQCAMISSLGCVFDSVATSDPAVVSILDLPIPMTADSVSLCTGNVLELMATGGSTYQWIAPNDSLFFGPIVTIPQAGPEHAGAWVLTATNINGCTDTTIAGVTVHPLPIVAIESGCLPDTVLASTPPFGLHCGIPSGGIYLCDGNPCDSFSPSLAGTGPHQIIYQFTDSLGCTDSAAASIFVGALGLKSPDAMKSLIKISPNPSTGWITIQATGLRGIVQMDVLNARGSVLYRQKFGRPGEYFYQEIDLSTAPKGIYLIRLNNQQGSFVRRIMVL